MLHIRRFFAHSRSMLLNVRFRSTIEAKHVKIERKAVQLNDLSPVVRQILSKDPSYAVRFGGELSDDKKTLVRQHSSSTGRAEKLFSQTPQEDLIDSIDETTKDFPHPPIVEFPTAENHFEMNLGSEDSTIPQRDNLQCFGCGAKLQCHDRAKAGFIPAEIYRKSFLSEFQRRSSQCQRCFLLKYSNELSHCEVNEDVYQQILNEIKRKRALIVLIVDLLDIPNSISRSWAKFLQDKSSSSNLVFVLGNKVDLLPKDSDDYLSNVRQCLVNECEKRGLGKHLIKYFGLISARTGFGIEEFISKVYRYWSQHGAVFLLGGTNAGKTSLFNSLMDSDLCHIHALDCLQRATVSNLPGTTMNVLRFPIQIRTGKNEFLRAERLKEREEKEKFLEEQRNFLDNETNLLENVESTVKWRRTYESEMNLPKSGVSYNYSSGENQFYEDRSFSSAEENFLDYRQKKIKGFNPKSYEKEKWLFDTPGVILPEQMINKCSNEKELSFFDHQSTVIRPIHISLETGKTILIGGIVRIDIKEMSSDARANISLMTTAHFPINVIQTKDFDDFYQKSLAKNQLGVPQNRINGRLQDPPELRGPTVEIIGIGEDQSASDIVLSSAGWISVQCRRDSFVRLEVKTPDGLGIYLREKPLLKCLSRLRGQAIDGTPFFEKLLPPEIRSDSIDDHSNEIQMIINEKLWKGEEIKRKRRAKRT